MTSSGNPIELDLKSKYTVKGLGKEQTIESVVKIHTTDDSSKIIGVEDRWNGNIPDGAIAKASLSQLHSLTWWANYMIAWGFWLWSWIWWTRVWNVGGFQFLDYLRSLRNSSTQEEKRDRLS